MSIEKNISRAHRGYAADATPRRRREASGTGERRAAPCLSRSHGHCLSTRSSNNTIFQMKVRGGLTHGRCLSDSVVSKWVLSIPVLIDINNFILDFCNVNFGMSEQHVDARTSRVARDAGDLQKLLNYFNNHDPFMASSTIMSISTGVKGDAKINSHKAFSVGVNLMNKYVGVPFDKLKFERKNKVLPQQDATSIKLDNDIVLVNPLLIFQRISVVLKDKEDLKNYLS